MLTFTGNVADILNESLLQQEDLIFFSFSNAPDNFRRPTEIVGFSISE